MGSPSKRADIKSFIMDKNPSIAIIQETKSRDVDNAFIKFVWSSRFVGWTALDAGGSSGGILIMWNELNIDIIETIKGVTPCL